MFHTNKQKAIEKCKGEWILQLDADEIVSPELREEIHDVIANRHPGVKQSQNLGDRHVTEAPRDDKIVAYWIPRLNHLLGKPLLKGGQYPDMIIRLYRNGVAHFPCKSVHEQVQIKNNVIPSEVEGSSPNDNFIGHLKSDLLHYPYPTFDAYLEKWVRYGVLEAEIWKQQGIRPSFFNSIKYLIILPKWWFLKTYFRHRGYTDGFPGFVFSLFSACRYWITYVKLHELF